MTVEELEIVITTNIQKAMPNIRKVVKEVKNAVNETKGLNADIFKGIDMGKVASDVSKATNTAIKETKKMKEQLKSLGLKDAGDTTGLKIQGIAREITGISNKFKELKAQKGALADVFDASKYKQQAEEMKRAVNSISGAGYKKYNTQSIQNAIDNFKGGSVKKTVVQADTKKAENDVDKLNAKLNNINGKKVKADVKTNASSELNKSNSFANKLKNAMQQVKKHMDSSGVSSKKISSGLSSALGSVSKVGGFLQIGLGQILKIAGALFSLRSIYSILSNSARAWLSSQNAQAQQLSANIDYMKYALGSALAPVIQWIVNLIYQALKGVQALIYALTGVNIFAKASAKSYAGMAGSAKKAKEETKQLAGIHNEINNIQDNKGSDSGGGGGGGGASPSFDLSNLDSKFSAWAEKVKAVLAKLFEPIKKAWDTYGQGLMESIKTSAIQIKELFVEVGKSFAVVWLNGTGEKTCGLILQILTSIVQTVGLIAESWKNAWVNNNNGTQIVQHLANAFNNILEIVLSVCNAFKEWWKTDQAQRFTNSIIGYFKIFSERVEKATQILKNLWEKGGKDAFTNLLNVIGKLAELWTALNEVVEPFVLTLMEELEPTLSLVVEWINKVLEALGGLLDFLIGIFTGDWERAWSGLGTYVGSAIKAVLILLAGLFEFIVKLPMKLLKKLSEKINEMAKELAKQIKGFFTQKIKDAGGNVAEGLWNGIIEGLGNIARWILDNIVNPFLDGFKKAMGINSPSTVMAELGRYIIEGLMNGIKEKVANLGSTVTSVCNNVKTWFSEKLSKSKFIENGKNTIEGIKDGLKNNSAQSTVSGICNNIKTWFNNNIASSKFIQNGKNVIEGIKNGLKNNSAYTNVANICSNIKTWFSNKLQSSNFITIGSNIINGIKKGISSSLSSLKRTVTSMAGNVSSWIKSKLDIHSPSRVLRDEVGKFIPLGIAEGIKSQAKSVYDSVNEIVNELKLDKQGLVADMSVTYSKEGINSNLSSGKDIMERALSSSILNSSNNGQPIQITLNVGNARLAKILLDDLRDMKRASGKDIEALVGG